MIPAIDIFMRAFEQATHVDNLHLVDVALEDGVNLSSVDAQRMLQECPLCTYEEVDILLFSDYYKLTAIGWDVAVCFGYKPKGTKPE